MKQKINTRKKAQEVTKEIFESNDFSFCVFSRQFFYKR
jgi:hypothetical protein